MTEWTQVSLKIDHFDALAKRAKAHNRSAAAELRVILQDAGVIPKPLEVKDKV